MSCNVTKYNIADICPLLYHWEFLPPPPVSPLHYPPLPSLPQRPPIEWLADPTAVAFCFPYVLALSEERNAIHVYNLVDVHQRCYQTLPFQVMGVGWKRLGSHTHTHLLLLLSPCP